MDINFITKAFLAGLGIALVAGPLGCFIIWRRMAYFGDALAHSALFGISLSLIFRFNTYLGLIISCLLVVLFLGLISSQKKISYDAILGILSHSILAIGLILASSIAGARIDLLSYLYGDILTIANQDLLWIFTVDVLVLGIIVLCWRKLVSFTIHEELAKVDGINVEAIKWLLFVLMAFVFAIAVKLVGVLLVTALLVIPAVSARFFARSPEQMAILAIFLGILSVYLGLKASLFWDWPTGPAVVTINSIIFAFAFIAGKFKSN